MVTAFVVPVTKSRLAKGLLAIPQDHADRFPSSEGVLPVFLGEDTSPTDLRFVPAKSTAKEARLYGLREWYHSQRVTVGQAIQIAMLDSGAWQLRLAEREGLGRSNEGMRPTVSA